MLRPEHLVTLREVVRLGSFAQAGNRLGYTASAVSQQMSALERELGVRLFDRGSRTIVPTEASRTVLRHGAGVLSSIDNLRSAIGDSARHASRVVRVGAFPSLAIHALAPSIAEMADDQRRTIRVSVGEPSELIPALGAGGPLDLAFVYQVGQTGLSWSAALDSRWLAEDPFQIAYPRSWARRRSATDGVEDFANLPWISHRPGTSDASVIDGMFARWDLRPAIVGYSDDVHSTLGLVAAGLGAAALPRLLLAHTPLEGIEVIQPCWFSLSRHIFGLYRPECADAALNLVMDAVASRLDPGHATTAPSGGS